MREGENLDREPSTRNMTGGIIFDRTNILDNFCVLSLA